MVIDAKYMDSAIEEAKLAFSKGETPVGAVVVCGGAILARAHNAVEACGDPSMHAELIALKAACSIKGRFLTDCTLYVTMEPCPMCAGACLNYRIGAVVFGAYDAACGAFGTSVDLGNGEFGRKIPVFGGVREEQCAALLKDFFKDKRG